MDLLTRICMPGWHTELHIAVDTASAAWFCSLFFATQQLRRLLGNAMLTTPRCTCSASSSSKISWHVLGLFCACEVRAADGEKAGLFGRNEDGIYTKKIEDMMTKDGSRLLVDIQAPRATYMPTHTYSAKSFALFLSLMWRVGRRQCDVGASSRGKTWQEFRSAQADECAKFLNDPSAYLPSFDKALQEVIEHDHAEYASKAKDSKTQFSVGFEGDFGDHQVTPRTLTSSYVNKLVCINGIVTKCSLVRPKVLKSVHFCEDTQATVPPHLLPPTPSRRRCALAPLCMCAQAGCCQSSLHRRHVRRRTMGS